MRASSQKQLFARDDIINRQLHCLILNISDPLRGRWKESKMTSSFQRFGSAMERRW